MKILLYVICSILVATLISCGSGELKKGEVGGKGYRSLAVKKYGEGAEFIQNSSGTAMLCVKRSKPTQLNPQQQIEFFVYDVGAQDVLFEDSIPNGSVSWNDDSSIVVTVIPGTVRDDDKTPARRSGYIYDIRSRKTRDLESLNVR